MNKSLNKLIGYSLIPALCLFLSKLVGIVFIAGLLNIDLQVVNFPDLLFFKLSALGKDVVALSTYSDLFMFMTIATGFSFVLVNALYFHETHINAQAIHHLAKYSLLNLIKSSYELYHSGVVWLVFVWLSNIIIAINVWRASTEVWLLVVTSVFALALTLLFFRDMFKELELTKYENTAH